MATDSMWQRAARVLAANPSLADEFYCMASEICDDFEDYGPVLQADLDGHYSTATTIIRLRDARNALRDLMKSS